MLKTDIMLDIGNHTGKRMHNSCGELFAGFCRNLVRISESI